MFEINNEYIENIHSLIAEGKDSQLTESLGPLHPSDIADVLDKLKRDDVHYIYKLLDLESRSDVLVELEDDVREDLLSTLTSKEIAVEVIEGLESDDAADVVVDLSEEKLEEVLSLVEDEEAKSDVIDLLNYEEGTAGSIICERARSGRRKLECCSGNQRN